MSFPFSRVDFQRLLEENHLLIREILEAQRTRDFQMALSAHNRLHQNLTRLASAADFGLIASSDSTYWPPGVPISSYWPHNGV
ncbi:hypothetical protein RCL1_005781 [Eukaryota sp. TZLM3-RCL]